MKIDWTGLAKGQKPKRPKFPAIETTLGRRKEIAAWLRENRRALGLCKGKECPCRWRDDNRKPVELQYIAAGPYFITKTGRRTRHLYVFAAPF